MKFWVVSEPKIGTLSQCTSVAKILDASPIEKTFVPNRGIRKIFDKPLFRTSEPPPTAVISCGFRAEKRVMAIKAAFKGKPITVHLQRPKIEGYDLVFVSRHGWSAELDDRPNYEKMLGVPHRFSLEFWNQKRPAARAKYAPDGEKIAAVFVGGSNGAYEYDQASQSSIAEAISTLADTGWKVLVSVSRRSSGETLSALEKIRSKKVTVWDKKTENPYVDYAAAADAFLIAKDSVTMPCEALSTGRPVYALELTHVPGERLEKFEWYHNDLQQNLGLTQPFDGHLAAYGYLPPEETKRISKIVFDRIAKQNADRDLSGKF